MVKPTQSRLPFGFDVNWYLYNKKIKDLPGWSQLPFGFDVDWYLVEFGAGAKIVVASQLPFGLDVDWYTAWASQCAQTAAVMSQLPFGFDVDWYKEVANA